MAKKQQDEAPKGASAELDEALAALEKASGDDVAVAQARVDVARNALVAEQAAQQAPG